MVQNGLALCSLHHKIFDLGAFTVLPGNHQIVFSRHLMGGDDTKAKLLAHHGAGVICRAPYPPLRVVPPFGLPPVPLPAERGEGTCTVGGV